MLQSKAGKAIIMEIELLRTVRNHISTAGQNLGNCDSVPFTSGRYCSPSSFFPNKLVSSVSVRENDLKIKIYMMFKSYHKTPKYSKCSRSCPTLCPLFLLHHSLDPSQASDINAFCMMNSLTSLKLQLKYHLLKKSSL